MEEQKNHSTTQIYCKEELISLYPAPDPEMNSIYPQKQRHITSPAFKQKEESYFSE